MLRLSGGQVESLFDLGLPIEVRELPADLAALDRLLEGAALLEPIVGAWNRDALVRGRPTIPMDRFVRLMLVKQRSGWGYETLVREVSDSLHLRRFCLIALAERVPDESTIRKLARRLGPEVIEEICRALIVQATTGRGRFVARAARIDSTVVEADVRYPTDLGLCADAAGALAREAARVGHLAGEGAPRVANRSRAVNRRLRTLNRTLARRTGQGAATALRLTGEAGTIVARSIRESLRLATALRARARGRRARAKLAAAAGLEQIAERATTVCRQIRQRVAGERISDRLVSIADPDARPIRKGKLRQPTEFGYVFQLAEMTESTRRGARGLILPAATQIGAAAESDLLPATGVDMARLGLRPAEVALDGGFFPSGVAEHLPGVCRAFIAGRQSAGSRRTNRRLARYRVGCEGRISHLKRRYGLRRSRLRGHQGARTWVAWAILAYNLDTLAIRGS
jgi:transposase, IS5 family